MITLTHDYILHNQILKEKDAVKYLGVTVHHRLSWNEHICSHQKHIKTNAYKTLVRPQIEYAYTIWDPFTSGNQNKIEMVQRRAAHFACNNYRREVRPSSDAAPLMCRT